MCLPISTLVGGLETFTIRSTELWVIQFLAPETGPPIIDRNFLVSIFWEINCLF